MTRRDALALALQIMGIVLFARFVAGIPGAYRSVAELHLETRGGLASNAPYYGLLLLLVSAFSGVAGAVLFMFGGQIAKLLMRRDAPVPLGELLHDPARLCEVYARLLGLLAGVNSVMDVTRALALLPEEYHVAIDQARTLGYLQQELITAAGWIVVTVVLIAAAGPIGRLVGGRPLVETHTEPGA